jgi:hypothetical protein
VIVVAEPGNREISLRRDRRCAEAPARHRRATSLIADARPTEDYDELQDDDMAPTPKPPAAVKKYKCYDNCGVMIVMCEDMGGGMSTEPDGAVVCTVYD